MSTYCSPLSSSALPWRLTTVALALSAFGGMVLAQGSQGLGGEKPAFLLTRKLEDSEKRVRDLEVEVNKLRKAISAKTTPDPEATRRAQQLDAALKEAQTRISTLEKQLEQAQAQRDAAQREAQAAAARKPAGATADEAALRSERDGLKRQLATANRDKDRLQDELQTAQQDLRSLKEAQRKATAAAASAPAVAVRTQPASGAVATPRDVVVDAPLQDKQTLTLLGCGSNCPTLVVLPQVGQVTLGTGSEARSVNINYRVLAGQTEVTVAQWRHFMQQSRYTMASNNTTYCDWQKEAVSDQHPVRCVSAEDADAYVKWLNDNFAKHLPGKAQIKLPTEDEWEFAARAGRWTQERQWDANTPGSINGGKENCSLATSNNCGGKANGYKPDPVAKTGRQANAWGLYDMVGNVWELTATPGGSGRVVRGGSFYHSDGSLRLSARNTGTPGGRFYDNGVRVFARIDL